MAASESNYGKAAGNELFGIKALPGQPGTSMQTHEGEYGGTTENQTFASYNTPQDAVDAFVNLIQNHYQGAVGAQSLDQFVHGLKQGGYFTAAEPEYKGILQGISDRIGNTVDSTLGSAQGAAQNVVQTGQTAVNTAVQAGQAAVARTSQFAMGLSSGDAMAFCGPAAAMAFAQTYGRNPTVDEAKQLATQVGWNPGQGMAGVGSEVKLLNAMGIDAHATQGVDWSTVAQDASSGNPVIIDTPGHYFYVDGYNAQTGQLHLGSSATDLKAAKGQEWFTPDQISSLGMGAPRAAIFADHPLSGPGQAATTARTQTPPATTMAGNQPASSSQPSVLGVPSSALLSALPMGIGAGIQSGQDLAAQLLGGGGSTGTQAQAQTVAQAVLNVGSQTAATGGQALGQLGSTSQDLLNQGQDPLTSAVSQAPQSLNDMLQQNQLLASGIPITGGSSVLPDLSAQGITSAAGNIPTYLQGLAQDFGTSYANAPTDYPDLFAQNPSLDLTKPLAPQLGFDPYGQIVQQGIPSIVSGVQQGNVGQALGGGLQTLLGVASVLPGGGGPETAAGSNLVLDALANPDLRALLSNRLATGPQTAAAAAQAVPGVADVPWSAASRALLQQGPAQLATDPAVQRALEQAATARALGVSPDVLAGQFDELGRRIPPGMIENPMTSAELGQPSYDQYGVFQREPALYSDRSIAMDPATGQEIVPPQGAPLDWRTQMPASSLLEGLQQMAQARGLDATTPLLTQRLADLTDQVNAAAGTPFGGRQQALATGQFARLLGGGAAGGLGAYEQTDPNDPNRALKIAGGVGLGALAGGPGLDLATQLPGAFARGTGTAPGAVSLGDWLSGTYKGGVIGGLNTMADVAANATITPILSAGAGLARDLTAALPGGAGGSPVGRIAGRTLGGLSGVADWTNNFLTGLSDSLGRTGTLSSRTSGAPGVLANLMEGAGALHGAFQNATSSLLQSMEQGAEAGGRAGGNIFDPAWHTNFSTQLSSLPPDVIARAQALGDRAAGRADLGTLTSAFGRLVTGGGPVMDALFPVYRMGMALGSRLVEASPLGLAGTGFDVARGLVGQGPYAAGLGSTPAGTAVGPLAERLTNNLIGTAVSVWLASKATGGAITGSGPSDPAQRQVWLANGNQPDSFLGPDGAYHSWDKLPPQLRGPMMAAGAYADAYQAYVKAQATQARSGPQAYGVEDPLTAAAGQLVSEVGTQLAAATPMRTLADLSDALQSGSSATGAALGAASSLGSRVLGGLMPESGLVRSIAQMTDPSQRQTLYPQTLGQLPQSVLENVQQNIPGLNQQLPARVDALGRALPNPLQGLGELSPFKAASGVSSPILQAYENAGVGLQGAPSTISFGPTHEIPLTPAQQRTFEQYRGQLLQQTVGPLVNSDQFKQMDPQTQKLVLSRINTNMTTAATAMLRGDLAPNAESRWQTTGVLAPTVGYSPDVLGNQLLLEQQLQRNAQHQVLIQSLLGAQAS